jgi:16S rRNA U516 pseudouridylate synthase RsuA-like enzyme
MRSDSARIPELVSLTLDRLATQAALHANGQAQEGFISVGQLRDDVLRGEFSAKKREKMWKGVRSVVEDNTNVRAAVREGRSGEVSRVWEWIGGMETLDLEDRRRSGRITWANEGKANSGQTEKSEKETTEMRKWDEGRPIY